MYFNPRQNSHQVDLDAPDRQASPTPPPTLEDARAAVRARTGITTKRRDDILSSLRKFETLCRHYDRQQRAEAPPPLRRATNEGDSGTLPRIIMTFAYAAPRLAMASPALLGVTPRRLGNIRCDVRAAIRHLGQQDPDAPLSPAWASALATLSPSSKFRRIALAGAARYFSAEGIAPESLTQEHVGQWREWRRKNSLAKKPDAAVASFLDSWNWACANVDGWPGRPLTREGRRKVYTFVLEAYPLSLQDDLDRFCRRISEADDDDFFGLDEDPFGAGAGASKPKRPAAGSTVRTRRFQARQALAALVHAGHSPDSLDSLERLVNPVENARTVLAFFRRRAKNQPSSQAAGIAEFLRQIAKFHHPQPEATIAAISKWGRKLGPKNGSGMTAKNRYRLKALVERRVRAKLLHLPAHLMRLASAEGLRPDAAALLAMQAVIFEVLLICPLRLKNVAALEIDRHLQCFDPRGRRIDYIVIPGSETKNGEPVHWPVPPETARLVQRFIEHHRRHLGDANSKFLFPGEVSGGRTDGTIRRNINVVAHRHLGVKLHPHLMRAYAAWSFLKDHPGEYETVRRVLGHRDLNTTIRYYCGIENEFAALKFDETVLRARRETRSLALAEFNKLRRKSKKPEPEEAEGKAEPEETDAATLGTSVPWPSKPKGDS